MFNRSFPVWGLLLLLSGVLLLIGGPMHPDPDLSLDFRHSTAEMAADHGWIPAHSFMLASMVMLLLGLIGLLRSGRMTGRMVTVNRIAIAGAVLGVIEMCFHLFAFEDADALANGGPAPIVTTHLTLAIFAYPILGLSLVVLAWWGGKGRILTHPWLAPIGVIGGLFHAIAAPLVVLSRDQHFSFLFKGDILLAVWLVIVGIVSLTSRAKEEKLQNAYKA